jgi:hypothetical protein
MNDDMRGHIFFVLSLVCSVGLFFQLVNKLFMVLWIPWALFCFLEYWYYHIPQDAYKFLKRKKQ